MVTLWRIGVSIVVILTFIYRLAFHDTMASNFETPPGYSAAKSIAQIEREDRLAFEKAMSESTQEKDKVADANQSKSKSPIQTMSVATKKLLKSVKNIASKKWVSERLAKLAKFKWKKGTQ